MRVLLLLPGRANPVCDDTEARLLGRLPPPGSFEADGIPKERRLTPDSFVSAMDEAAEACDVRLRELLRVTLFGTQWPSALPLRGLARGGVCVGAGSLDRAECTRSSSFCILPISPRIWYKEPDLGKPPAAVVPPILGRAMREEGAVVLIEGVVRPLAPILGLGAVAALGPRECLGGLDW